MEQMEYLEKLERILEKNKAYKKDAYIFVLEALDYTLSKLTSPRHLAARELLEGMREFGIEQFGPMVLEVFAYWGVKKTDDFGEIVFNLIEGDLLTKRDTDSKEDFKGVFVFQDVFKNDFKFNA